MKKQKIKICFKDGLVNVIPQRLWTDYQYVNNNFVVKRGSQWIGIYNMDDISCVVVSEKGMGKKKEEMKLFISQPMNGLSDEQILKVREKAIDKVHKLYPDRDVEVLPSLFENYNPTQGNIGMKFLGKSIEMLADADVAYFCEGWEEARGCRMEHLACEEYGVEIIHG